MFCIGRSGKFRIAYCCLKSSIEMVIETIESFWVSQINRDFDNLGGSCLETIDLVLWSIVMLA
jgi:hypothetical protein